MATNALKFQGGPVETNGMRESHEGATPTTLDDAPINVEMVLADQFTMKAYDRLLESCELDGAARVDALAKTMTAVHNALYWARKAATFTPVPVEPSYLEPNDGKS